MRKRNTRLIETVAAVSFVFAALETATEAASYAGPRLRDVDELVTVGAAVSEGVETAMRAADVAETLDRVADVARTVKRIKKLKR